MLVRYVKEHKLSGQVLHVRTGTLRRKINYRVTQTAAAITGQVGVKLSYAAAHEYGLDVEEQVREHLRTAKMAFGRPIAPVTFSVRAHTRHMKLPERSFLRSSLREMTPEIQAMIRAAVVTP
jgi:phage gpG-like protein